MSQKKKVQPKEKAKIHPRNKHKERYDFKVLIEACPELAPFVKLNIHNDESIDFADAEAVKILNKSLLKHFYKIENWDIPEGYLCPPIPGRADYIHHLADLLRIYNYGKIPTGSSIKCLDIGIGANGVYPIIGNNEYGWTFIGSDIDIVSIESVQQLIENNPFLKEVIDCRLQTNPKDIFTGILKEGEFIDFSICNPPFHASKAEAEEGTLRKLSNLNQKVVKKVNLNFGGQNGELWCEGGEERFVRNMIRQSRQFKNNCFWFSSLISKQANLKSIYEALEKAEAFEVKTLPMGQGNKTSRIVAWTFLDKEQQKEWKNSRWNS
jgi:23S rRNA (adenine1618-N6)-methyltransferase